MPPVAAGAVPGKLKHRQDYSPERLLLPATDEAPRRVHNHFRPEGFCRRRKLFPLQDIRPANETQPALCHNLFGNVDRYAPAQNKIILRIAPTQFFLNPQPFSRRFIPAAVTLTFGIRTISSQYAKIDHSGTLFNIVGKQRIRISAG